MLIIIFFAQNIQKNTLKIEIIFWFKNLQSIKRCEKLLLEQVTIKLDFFLNSQKFVLNHYNLTAKPINIYSFYF